VRDQLERLGEFGTDAVGISPDPPAKQRRFDDKQGLGYPLLSDPDHAVARAWGAWGEKVFLGKRYQGILRSALLVDEAGRIAAAWYKIKAGETASRVLAELQT